MEVLEQQPINPRQMLASMADMHVGHTAWR